MAWVFPTVTVVLGCLIVGTTQQMLMPCPQCSDVYDPICGKSEITDHIRTFNNSCLMQVANCGGRDDYRIFNTGECANSPTARECMSFCTGTYDPICTVYDFSGKWKNYSNECMTNGRNCEAFPNAKKVAEGPCRLNTPVCGRYANGNTQIFPNYCSLLLENCKVPDAGIEKVFDNECDTSTSTGKTSAKTTSTETNGAATSTENPGEWTSTEFTGEPGTAESTTATQGAWGHRRRPHHQGRRNRDFY